MFFVFRVLAACAAFGLIAGMTIGPGMMLFLTTLWGGW